MAHPRSRRRDTTDITNEVAFTQVPITIRPVNVPSRRLQEYEDRRSWNPEGSQAPARSFNSSRHRLSLAQKHRNGSSLRTSGWSQAFTSPGTVAFANPSRVLVCVRRQQRREVLHAIRKTGYRNNRKSPKFNYYSKIACR